MAYYREDFDCAWVKILTNFDQLKIDADCDVCIVCHIGSHHFKVGDFESKQWVWQAGAKDTPEVAAAFPKMPALSQFDYSAGHSLPIRSESLQSFSGNHGNNPKAFFAQQPVRYKVFDQPDGDFFECDNSRGWQVVRAQDVLIGSHCRDFTIESAQEVIIGDNCHDIIMNPHEIKGTVCIGKNCSIILTESL